MTSVSKSLVIITGDQAEHRYVANRICERFPVVAIFVADPPPRRSWKKALRQSVVGFCDKAMLRLFLSLVGDSKVRTKDLRAVLGERLTAEFHIPDKVVRVGRPKSGKLTSELKRCAPDFIAVYGTGIIPDSALKQARIMAFNMHTGISPEYRGAACAFWPIYNREPHLIGATVHECTSVVDGGKIFKTSRARLFRGDSLHKIFARAVRAGADAYVEVLQNAFDGNLTGWPQDVKLGREYKGSMRGIVAEVLGRHRLGRMSRTWDPRPAE